MENLRSYFLFPVMLILLSFPLPAQVNDPPETGSEEFKGESPWPEIRKKRISTLLPEALKAANVNAWMVIARENNNDPLADHVGGENAGGTVAFLFYNDAQGFHSLVFSPSGESTALDELDMHDKVIPVERGASAVEQAMEFIRKSGIKKVAINSSENNSLADGLSYTQRMELEKLNEGDEVEFVSSEDVVYEWLSVKLPEEVEIMRKAAKLTAEWEIEAYKDIVPGETLKFLQSRQGSLLFFFSWQLSFSEWWKGSN